MSLPDLAITLLPETAADQDPIERLHERAFGPGRFARTAFRLRETAEPLRGLSFVARVGTLVVGSVRLSRIAIGPRAAVLLGPLTVEPAFMGRGIGAALMRATLDAARAAGHDLVLLVGDEPYYGRFGFTRAPNGLALPGPVDPARVLVAALSPGAADGAEGMVRPLRGAG
jgi:predicted N-acetyltransferase YhbS